MAEVGMYLGEARLFAETTDPAAKALLLAAAREARAIRDAEALVAGVQVANQLSTPGG